MKQYMIKLAQTGLWGYEYYQRCDYISAFDESGLLITAGSNRGCATVDFVEIEDVVSLLNS